MLVSLKRVCVVYVVKEVSFGGSVNEQMLRVKECMLELHFVKTSGKIRKNIKPQTIIITLVK